MTNWTSFRSRKAEVLLAADTNYLTELTATIASTNLVAHKAQSSRISSLEMTGSRAADVSLASRSASQSAGWSSSVSYRRETGTTPLTLLHVIRLRVLSWSCADSHPARERAFGTFNSGLLHQLHVRSQIVSRVLSATRMLVGRLSASHPGRAIAWHTESGFVLMSSTSVGSRARGHSTTPVSGVR